MHAAPMPSGAPARRRGRLMVWATVAVLLFAALLFSARYEVSSLAASPDLARLRAVAALEPCPAALSPELPQVREAACLDGGGPVTVVGQPPGPFVINAWAYWCEPCQREIPLLVDLAARAGDRLSVVGVVSTPGEVTALQFATDFGVTYPNLLDPQGRVFRSVGGGLPQTLFIDSTGEITWVQGGEIQSRAELDRLVAQHLGIWL